MSGLPAGAGRGTRLGTALTVLGDLALAFAIFFSANMALAWGELAAFDVQGDKSGLAGLLGALVFVLGVHTVLGVVSYQGLEWISGAIQRSDPEPQRLAWAFAFLLPLPAIAAAAWGLNRDWLPRHRFVALGLVAAVIWAHVAGWRAGIGGS